MNFQLKKSTSMWKKVVFIARTKGWTPREVIEHAVSVAYYLHETESMGKRSVGN